MNPLVVFFHIDKTGGTTVCDYLARQFPQEQIKPVPIGKAQDLVGIAPTTYGDLYAANRKFSILPGQRLIMGHYDTGILDYLLCDVITMTVLREPVARVVSLYRYVEAHDELYGNLSLDARRLGLEGWLRRYVDLWDNAMTKQLAGVRWSTGHQEVDERVYQMAVDRLKAIDYVGITKHLPIFLEKVASGMGWDAPEPKRLNATLSLNHPIIDEGTMAFIEAHTKYDTRLYQVAESYD